MTQGTMERGGKLGRECNGFIGKGEGAEVEGLMRGGSSSQVNRVTLAYRGEFTWLHSTVNTTSDVPPRIIIYLAPQYSQHQKLCAAENNYLNAPQYKYSTPEVMYLGEFTWLLSTVNTRSDAPRRIYMAPQHSQHQK